MFSTTRTQKVLVSNPSVLQVVIVIVSIHVASVSTSDNANIDVDDVNVAEMMKDDDGITIVDDVNVTEDMLQVRVQAMMLNKTSSKIMYDKDGVITVNENYPLSLEFFGVNLDRVRKVKFITTRGKFGGPCDSSESAHFQVIHYLFKSRTI